MDFHQLRVFVEVARQKSFSRAAEKIFLTQPTVSAHIKSLEKEIGTPLLVRGQRELQLTDAGKVLFQYAQQLLNLEKKAVFAIQQEYHIIKGNLEIVASSVPSSYILPGLMKDFLKKYPLVTFSAKHWDTEQVFENILNFNYELGFAGEPVRSNKLNQIQLLKDNLILVAAANVSLPGEKRTENKIIDLSSPLLEIDLKAYPVQEMFLKEPFVMRETGSATRMIFENALKKFYGKTDMKLNVVAYLENQETIKEAVKAGLGLTVISHRAVETELSLGLMKGYLLPDLQLERYLYLVYRSNSVLSPLSQAFLDHCIYFFKIAEEN